MEPIENGMVVGAMEEWERLNADTPSDEATTIDFDNFAWETDRVAEVLVHGFGLDDGDLTEDVAKVIYSALPRDYAMELVSGWAETDRAQDAYDAWAAGRNE